MRRNVSSNSLRDYLEGGTGTTMREINRERYSGMTKSSSHNSLSELIGRPQHGMPRNGSRGNLAAMGMPRNGSRGNLSAMDRVNATWEDVASMLNCACVTYSSTPCIACASDTESAHRDRALSLISMCAG